MAIKKKKISELTLSDNLKGLYTIGVKLINGVQTSVKVKFGIHSNGIRERCKSNQQCK